jgi:hypothetical protein
MPGFYADVSGLMLMVRKTNNGWEASISGPSTVIEEATAKSMAIEFAAKLSGKPISNVQWKPIDDGPRTSVANFNRGR